MSQPEQNFETGRPSDLDRSIDAALAKYSAVEPRAGLEDRVLANLRSGHLEAQPRTWWRLVTAAALIAIAVVAIAVVWRSAEPSSPVITKRPPANVQVPAQPEKAPLDNEATVIAGRKRRPIRRTRTQAETPAVAARPRLDQFPSPQPLSPEEIALAQYVEKFPKEARLVAQAQEEFALETQKQMNDAGAESRTSDSIQQER